jgi:GT2 family glycosyltransferase
MTVTVKNDEYSLDVCSILEADNEQFLIVAYNTLLDRNPDSGGVLHYAQRLRIGVPKQVILAEMWNDRIKEGLPVIKSATMQKLMTWYRLFRSLPLGKRRWTYAPSFGAKITDASNFDWLSWATKYINNNAQPKINNIQNAFSIEANRYKKEFTTRPYTISLRNILALPDEEFLEQLYHALILRKIDTGGLMHYLSELRDGQDRLYILSQIYHSEEANNVRNFTDIDDVDDKTFLEKVYQRMLGRAPDFEGKEIYLPLIKKGQRHDVIKNIQSSPEFQYYNVHKFKFINELKELLNEAPYKKDVHQLSSKSPTSYSHWLEQYEQLSDQDRKNFQFIAHKWVNPPRITVIIGLFDHHSAYLTTAVESIMHQLYLQWQLIIVVPISIDAQLVATLTEYSQTDSRIIIERVADPKFDLSVRARSILEQVNEGFLWFLEPWDQLNETALYWLAETLINHPDARLIYTDEDCISSDNVRSDPYFKPDYNYELHLAQDLMGKSYAIDVGLLKLIGGFRSGLDGCEHWDLSLRAIERIEFDQIQHLPRVLYHRGKSATIPSEDTRLKVVQEHLQRKGQAALVVPAPDAPQYNRVLYRRDIAQPSVTIIIPTRDNIDLLECCVESISQKTTYSNYNILIIDNGSKENGTLKSLQNLKNNKNISVICMDITFNYSTLNNLAAKNTSSDLLCFLNDDTEIISPDWLEEMTSFANQEDIGVVGARLWYPDGRLQHAGVVTGIHGISDHIYRYLERGNSGYYGRAVLHQSYSAVTGACMVVRRDVFEQVGGFDETLAVTLNDIDLCLKVRSIGYRNVWTPYAEVIHHESASRGSGNLPGSAYEITIFTSRWRDVLYNDPAYNVNLSLQNTHCALAYPPRQMRYGNLSSAKLAMLEMNRFPVIEEARLLTDDFFVNSYSLLIEENKRLKKQIYDLTDDRYREYNLPKEGEGNLIVCNEMADTQEPNQDLLPATREKPVWLERYYIDIIVESGLFDSKWYLNQYGEKFGIIGDPLEHYLVHGMEISANPSPNFDTAYYLQANPDLAESPLHPFVHFVCQGHKENRPFLPPPPPEYESKYSAAEPEYISRLPADTPPVEKCVRVIAFYLPQFHAIPENDKWWGEGFTEWTNVKPAKPQFEGHYQPHVPDDFLGYYNLLDSKTQLKQIELAKQYGVEGFCFYIYWFSGRRLLEQPVDNYLSDSKLGLPFCVCWANENWSRRWDGLDSDLLMEQRYSPEDDIEFIANTAKYLRDPRYIRISGKPLLLVYRPNLFPNMRATTQRWRVWCREHGIGEIYLTYPQSFECVDPAEYGFDAACEFPPNNSSPPNITHKLAPKVEDFQTVVYDWRILLDRSDEYEIPKYTLFRSVTPSWDNTARKKNKGTVFQHSCPKLFEKWLTNAFVDTLVRQQEVDEQIVFVNAWNEWAEGAHLEPDKKYGYAWLQAVRNAHNNAIQGDARHTSLMEGRWNMIEALFKAMPDRKQYGFLSDYLSLLQQGRRKGIEYQIIDSRPTCTIKNEPVCIDRRERISAIHRNIYGISKYCFVVLQFNKSDLTIACVRSLQNLERYGLDIKIIIVDNKSETTHVEAIIQEFVHDIDVTILFSDENKGFSGGNNIGYHYARNKLHAQFCVVINNDTEINQANFINRSIELYDKYSYSLLGPDILIADGRHENPWNDYIYSIDEFKHLQKTRNHERQEYEKGSPPSFSKIGKCSVSNEILLNPLLQGAALVMSPIFIADHENLFDERLFLYGEEFLLATECLINGDLTIYTNKLVIEHHEGATTATLAAHQKMIYGYDSAIKSIDLCVTRLERKRAALLGRAITHDDNLTIRKIVAAGGRHVLIDLFFCQPGYHGGGEYGKAVFKKLVENCAEFGGFELWAAINPALFIDAWVWEMCSQYGINIVAVNSYDDIIGLVNADIFFSFFAPAIVVYTGYEYMKRIGGVLPFKCKQTRVIGTLLDIRDYELSRDYEKILVSRKSVGCEFESGLSEEHRNRIIAEKEKMADDLKIMYAGIISNSHVQIVTISKYCENSIYENIGVPANPLKVLMSPMKPRPAPVRPNLHALGIDEHDFVLILHAGRFEKNAVSAIKALDLLFAENASYRNLKVVLTGVSNISETGLSKVGFLNNFISVGDLVPETLEYLLDKARVLIYPSFNEGFGYPPIEAMSYGTRCVASNITAIPEVCRDAIEYFDPFDVLSIKQAIIRSLSSKTDNSLSYYRRYNLIRDKQSSALNELIALIAGC